LIAAFQCESIIPSTATVEGWLCLKGTASCFFAQELDPLRQRADGLLGNCEPDPVRNATVVHRPNRGHDLIGRWGTRSEGPLPIVHGGQPITRETNVVHIRQNPVSLVVGPKAVRSQAYLDWQRAPAGMSNQLAEQIPGKGWLAAAVKGQSEVRLTASQRIVARPIDGGMSSLDRHQLAAVAPSRSVTVRAPEVARRGEQQHHDGRRERRLDT
jgi:hypothetical protein